MQRTTKIIILISIGFLSPLKALALPAPEDIP
ncbi:MAG: glutathione S-transferase, partial [Microcystis panniformis]